MARNRQIFFLSITFICLFVDQIVKFVVDNFLPLNEEFNLCYGVLSLEKVYNTGAAFSILQNNTIVLILISMITIALIMFLVFRKNSKLTATDVTALAFISGGALGNLIDRLIYSYVVDFIQLDFINFPIFNFADVFINIGVIILIVSVFVLKNDKQ